MELVQLTVESRQETGKSAARRVRAGGAVPGVVYGLHRETQHLSVETADLHHLTSGSDANVLIDLEMPGVERESSVAAMIKSVQRDPVTRAPLSVDFQWVSLTELIVVEVPLEVVGVAPGVEDDGGVIDQHLHTVSVQCLPTAIPSSIAIDIDGMHITDSRFVGDLPEIDGVTYMLESDQVILSIAAPISEADLETRTDEDLESLVELEVGGEVEEAEGLEPEEAGEAEETGETDEGGEA
jgi:large subunit ribosomal protein L25